MHFQKKKEGLFIVGIISLMISILLNQFATNFLLMNFLEGVFTGISLVTNLGYLFMLRSDKSRT
ncbi:MAG: hypothetical protein ACFFFY_12060 [Promethearchaeota archaeon]